MGSVFKKITTRRVPKEAVLTTRLRPATAEEREANPKQETVLETVATWRGRKGKKRTAVVFCGPDGVQRIRTESARYYAQYRDGNGQVQVVPTNCGDLQAARAELADLMLTADRVRSKLLTSADCRILEQAEISLEQHLQAYFGSLELAGNTKRHISDLKRQANRLITECKFRLLRDLDPNSVERWLLARSKEKMGARTRNIYLQSLVGFCNWCVKTGRLRDNPLQRISKAKEVLDRRLVRRSLTLDELRRLLYVAKWRPLAEQGRQTEPNDPADAPKDPKSRKTWHRQPLSLDSLPVALQQAKDQLKNNPTLLAELVHRGWERSLIYKVAVLTGLRRGEIESLTVASLVLDAPDPFVRLEAASTKNKQAVELPLKVELVEDLRRWLDAKRNGLGGTGQRRGRVVDLPASTKLFAVPKQIVKALDRDLAVAGIPKIDDRGMSIDFHAFRHTFATFLSTSGVAPRTAQQAMRHSRIDLTMNVYTDPRLLDLARAIKALPVLSESDGPSSESAQADETDELASTVASKVALAGVLSCPKQSFTDNLAEPAGLVGAQKNPANLAISQGLFSEVDGARTRNLRRDRPGDDTKLRWELAVISLTCVNGCHEGCTCAIDCDVLAEKLRAVLAPDEIARLVIRLLGLRVAN